MNLKNIFRSQTKLEKTILDQIKTADKELRLGYQVIEKYPRSVSILGSARYKSDNIYYQKAESLGKRIVKDLGYTVVTGGGPGIMEAANKGAFEAQGKSIGFGIKLPMEQKLNPYLTESVNFEYFFTRKTLLFFAAEAYVYYPGGFGTADELFGVLTLMQTGEISQAPVILVGSEFWTPLMKTIEKEMLDDEQTISPTDTKLYRIVDSEDEIISIIKAAKLRND